MLTIITAPVDVDAASVVAGELGKGEAGGVGWKWEKVSQNNKYSQTALPQCNLIA